MTIFRPIVLSSFSLLALSVMGCATTSPGAVSTVPTPPGTSTVTGTSYYVSATGSDSATGLSSTTPFKTIQHAADLTNPGDTVFVMNGTYTNIGTSPVLEVSRAGSAAGPITFTAFAGATPVIQFNGWNGIQFDTTAAYIVVQGLTVYGNNDNVTLAQAQMYQLVPASHAELNGNGISVDGRRPTTSARPNHISILNNVVGKCGGGGISSIESDYITISGNTVFNTSWYSAYGTSAISMLNDYNSDTTTGYKMIVTGNRMYNNQEYIPYISVGKVTDGEGIIIDTNMNTTTSDGSILTPYTGRTFIANNVVINDGSAAIEAFRSSHIDVVNNSSYGDVLNAAVTGRGEMNLNTVTDVNVLNNIFYATKGQNPLTVASCTTCYINYNQYFNGTNSPTSSSGVNDVIADPLFTSPAPTDPSKFDLSVSAASPAVDTGTSYLAPVTDIAGTPRYQGKAYDRGAYER